MEFGFSDLEAFRASITSPSIARVLTVHSVDLARFRDHVRLGPVVACFTHRYPFQHSRKEAEPPQVTGAMWGRERASRKSLVVSELALSAFASNRRGSAGSAASGTCKAFHPGLTRKNDVDSGTHHDREQISRKTVRIIDVQTNRASSLERLPGVKYAGAHHFAAVQAKCSPGGRSLWKAGFRRQVRISSTRTCAS